MHDNPCTGKWHLCESPAHEGAIKVKPESEGSVFIVELPLKNPEPITISQHGYYP